ncbi:MAG: hypothetical protein F4Z34_09485 [Acidimicrobiaceae bacterium]|nr:hypothetical protein [Acidimicrobiaceae bacterium]
MTTGARAAERDPAAPPAALLDAVDEHCRALAATAAGRVFTVPVEDAEAALRSEVGRGVRYDTVLSCMCTPRLTSLEDYVAAVEQVLADGGWILMVEPDGIDRGTLPRWLISRSRWRSPLLRTRGRDVVSAVRARGLVITDIQRREARSAPASWRRYVVMRVRRATPRPERP